MIKLKQPSKWESNVPFCGSNQFPERDDEYKKSRLNLDRRGEI